MNCHCNEPFKVSCGHLCLGYTECQKCMTAFFMSLCEILLLMDLLSDHFVATVNYAPFDQVFSNTEGKNSHLLE